MRALGISLENLQGFIGCLQNLRVNSNEINSNNAFISSSDSVIFNSCEITNHCSPNPCENGKYVYNIKSVP